MTRLLFALSLLLPSLLVAQAPARVTFTASSILDSGGSSPLASGEICFVTTDANDRPMGYRLGTGSGQTSASSDQAPCANVTAGVIAPIQIINSAASSPLNACIRIVTKNAGGGEIRRNKCVQTGTSDALMTWCTQAGGEITCDWNKYPIGTTPVPLVQAGGIGPPGEPGCVIGSSGCVTVGDVPASGLDPTGAMDNSSIIGSYIAANPGGINLPAGTFFASTANPNGVPIGGNGTLLKGVNQQATSPVTGAVVTATRALKSSYADKSRMVLGREYLNHFHDALLQSSVGNYSPQKVVYSGDSTTAGDNTSAPFRMSDMLQAMAVYRGFQGVSTVNAGHSGQTSAQWLSSWLTADLATNPDVYIIRWGINDAPFGITPAQHLANIRAGLAQIRASKTVDQMAVVLMMPSSTNDNPNGRAASFYEQLRDGYVQLARDYQAAFIDTYGELPDSDSAITSMDSLYESSPGHSTPVIHLHPNNTKNILYGSLVADLLFPANLQQFASNNVINVVGSMTVPPVTTLPSSYAQAIAIYRTDSTWPYDGASVTIKHAEGVWLQYNFGYTLTTSSYAFRTSRGPNQWNAWQYSSVPVGFAALPNASIVPGSTALEYASGNGFVSCFGPDSTTECGIVIRTVTGDGSAGHEVLIIDPSTHAATFLGVLGSAAYSGTVAAAACFDASGKLYRSATASCP